MKKVLVILLIGVIIGTAINALGFFYFSHSRNDSDNKIDGNTQQVITLDQIKEVAKIVSVEYYMADVVDYANDNIWPFSDEKILVIAKAKILAGFDLTKRFDVTMADIQETLPQDPQQSGGEPQETVEHTTITRRQFTLTLPPPEIIAIQPQYKYYDIQGTPPPDAHTYVLNLAKVNLYNAAKREGILQKAKASCRKQMEQLLSGFDIVINFWDDIEPATG